MKSFLTILVVSFRLNLLIIKYAGKTIAAYFSTKRNLSALPSKYVSDVIQGKHSPVLPMGFFEYDSCAEYSKKLFRAVWSSFFNQSDVIEVQFNYNDAQKGLELPPLDDCLDLVSKEAGLKKISDTYDEFGYNYKFQILS